MRHGGVLALVFAALSALGQECGEVVVNGPKELVAGGIWSLAAHWTALPPGKNINILYLIFIPNAKNTNDITRAILGL